MDVVFVWLKTSVAMEEADVDARGHHRVAVVLVPVVAQGMKLEITQFCVVGIKYIFSDHVAPHPAVQSLAEVAQSHRPKRNRAPDLVQTVLALAIQIAVEARHP